MDALPRSDVLRRRELPSREALAGLCAGPVQAALPAAQLLTDGVLAVTDAARAGAFVLGYWRAQKPPGGPTRAVPPTP